jgi:hypothetical protein
MEPCWLLVSQFFHSPQHCHPSSLDIVPVVPVMSAIIPAITPTVPVVPVVPTVPVIIPTIVFSYIMTGLQLLTIVSPSFQHCNHYLLPLHHLRRRPHCC